MRDVPAHYLRNNERQWSPPSIMILDTETRVIQEDPEVQGMRLWVAQIVDRRKQNGRDPRCELADGDTVKELADQVCAWAKQRNTVWVYCHNLAFDLTVTRLPILMCARGWEVSDAAVDSRSPWLRLSKGRHTLTFCDSHSYFPVALATVGSAVRIPKPPLPEGDDRDSWLARCTADVLILAEAMLSLLDFWDDNGLGNFSITGSACGWNAMRHMPSPWRVLVVPDDDRRGFDRRAIYGGRRGVWHCGDLPAGRYVEADFERAYTVVAAELPLPVRPGYKFESLPISHRLISDPHWGIIAECVIETDTPRWPVKMHGRVWYPVGRFTTTLAGPDILEARNLGCLVSVGKGWVHALGYYMRPWARWCLAMQAAGAEGVPDVVKIWLKHTGRSVIGKWAQRKYTRTRLGYATTAGWGYEDAWINSCNAKGSIIDIGGVKFLSVADGDGDNSYPAILAWVESYVRVRLGRIVDRVGPDKMVQCDTDGMILESEAMPNISEFDEMSKPLTLRIKTAYKNLTVIGPQHMILDGKRRFSGIPGSAEPNGKGELEAWTWPHMGWQMKHGDVRGYVRTQQRYVVDGTYAPAWVTASGAARPVEVTTAAGGTNTITLWPKTRHARSGDRLGGTQNDILTRIAAGTLPAASRQDTASAAPRHVPNPRAGVEKTPCIVPPMPHSGKRDNKILRRGLEDSKEPAEGKIRTGSIRTRKR